MTAETCGRSAMPANVAPPLKSTSTKLSASGEWVIDEREHQGAQQLGLARAGGADDQSVRPHALLGRLLDVERDDRPRPRRRRSAPGAGRAAAAAARRPPGRGRARRPDRAGRRARSPALNTSRASGSSPAYRGADRRAAASARTVESWSADAVGGAAGQADDLERHGSGPRAPAGDWPTARRSVVAEVSSPHCSGRSSTVTPSTPSGVTTGLPGGTSPPSTTSEHVRQRGPARSGRTAAARRSPGAAAAAGRAPTRRPAAPARRRRARAGSVRAAAT